MAQRRAARHTAFWAFSVIALILSVIVTAGCAGGGTVRHTSVSDLAWPADDPRVRLQDVIDLAADPQRTGAKFRRWLGEAETTQAFTRPYGVAWHEDDLLITDPDSGIVASITSGGQIARSSAGLFDQPIGVAACRDGIVVSDSVKGAVALLNSELQLLRWLAQDLSRPTGVACAEGRVFVADTGEHRLVILEPDGTRRHLGGRGSGPGEFNFPVSVAIDRGVLYVGDTMNFRIQRVDAASGKPLGAFGELGDSPGEMPRLKGISVDSAGHLWVADAYLDQVLLYDDQGNFLLAIGGSGSGAAEFLFPAGIAARRDGTVAVADSLNRRLKVFRVLERAAQPGL